MKVGARLRSLLLKTSGLRISVGVSLLLAGLYLVRPPILEVFELKLYDQRLKWRGALSPTGQVAIVAIDEKSLAEVGQWPWSRIILAELIEAISSFGPKAIGVDVIWSEPEKRLGVLDAILAEGEGPQPTRMIQEIKEELKSFVSQSPQVYEFLRRLSREVHPDEVLAKAIEDSGKVVVGDFLFMKQEEIPENYDPRSPNSLLSLSKSQYSVVRLPFRGERELPTFKAIGPKGNLPEIAMAAKAIGFFNIVPDMDGVVRAVPLVVECGEGFLAPLSVQTLRYAGDPFSWSVEAESFGILGIKWPNGFIPTSEDGFMLINFRGKAGTFPRVSAVDVLRGNVSREALKDKIVFVGAVATGIFDLRVTPFDSACPGVEVHANIVDNILRGDFIQKPGWAATLDLLVILIGGVVLGLLYPKLRPLLGALAMITLFFGHLWLNARVLWESGFWLNAMYPSVLILTSYLGVTIHGFVREEREKRKLKGAFQVYVPPEVVQEIIRNPQSLRLGGQQKVLTVLFSDIRGFTSISEVLDPEALVRLLNEYLTEMTQVIFRHEGTLDKYMGDAIMAIYGAPIFKEDHPARACLSALEMLEVMKKLKGKWDAMGLPPLDIGIGINTGEMVVGNMGSEKRFDYTVMGDHVNLASRLEGLNKQYGTRIILSEFTLREAGEGFLCRELDLVRVKGKRKPVRIYELLGLRPQGKGGDASWIEVFEGALSLYRERRWEEAEVGFREVLRRRPNDGPSKLFLKRCEILKASPPPSWEGIFDWEVK